MKTMERPTSFPAVVDLIVPKKTSQNLYKNTKTKRHKDEFFL